MLYQTNYSKVADFKVKANDYLVIIGSDGSGKNVVAQVLRGKLLLYLGEYQNNFRNVALLSFEKQRTILEKTFQERNNDTVSPDYFGTSVRDVILSGTDKYELCDAYVRQFKG